MMTIGRAYDQRVARFRGLDLSRARWIEIGRFQQGALLQQAAAIELRRAGVGEPVPMETVGRGFVRS